MSKMLGLYRILLSAVLWFVQQRRPSWGHREVLRAMESRRGPLRPQLWAGSPSSSSEGTLCRPGSSGLLGAWFPQW